MTKRELAAMVGSMGILAENLRHAANGGRALLPGGVEAVMCNPECLAEGAQNLIRWANALLTLLDGEVKVVDE